MVTGFAAQGLYTGSLGEHEEKEAKRGYTGAGAEEAGNNTGWAGINERMESESNVG